MMLIWSACGDHVGFYSKVDNVKSITVKVNECNISYFWKGIFTNLSQLALSFWLELNVINQNYVMYR